MWGPAFLRDIVANPTLQGSHIVLHDINPAALDLVFDLGEKMIGENDLPFTLEKTLELEEALPDADVVILTITTGGLKVMRHDLEIPKKYGIYQSVGDTVGPGGLARCLRNIPVIVDIARRMERLCPDAWLLNYTNPMTTICRAVCRTTGIKTVGLCHEFFGVLRTLQRVFEVDTSEIQAKVGGINHLTWVVDLKVKGKDAFPALKEFARQVLASKGEVKTLDAPGTASTIDRFMVKAHLFQVFGAFPAAGDRHVAEFFPYFLTEAAGRGKAYGVELTTVEERYQWQAEDKALIQDLLTGRRDMRQFLAEHSGEAADQIIAAIANAGSYTGVMNLPNQGQIFNLPAGVVVETFGTIDANGAQGLTLGELPPGILNVVSRHVLNQEMAVEAALSGDRHLALQVLFNDPLTREFEGVGVMLDEMLFANKQYLPQFFL